MGLRITALALWTALLVQFLPAFLWAEGSHFHPVPSPLARQIHRTAEDLVDSGLGLLVQGGHRLSVGNLIGR